MDRMEKMEKFVREWQKADSLEEVAGALEMTPRQASCQAAALRKHGVALKRFTTNSAIDWSQLSAIIDNDHDASLGGGEEPPPCQGSCRLPS